MADFEVRMAAEADLDGIKRLFDAHRNELGFVLRPSLVKSIQSHEMLVAVQGAVVLGAVHYHHRRDGQTTLYHIAVFSDFRRRKVGLGLVRALQAECQQRRARFILLKCPSELNANRFYEKAGFHLREKESGKHRALNIWIMQTPPFS